jgi:hypothetical protein
VIDRLEQLSTDDNDAIDMMLTGEGEDENVSNIEEHVESDENNTDTDVGQEENDVEREEDTEMPEIEPEIEDENTFELPGEEQRDGHESDPDKENENRTQEDEAITEGETQLTTKGGNNDDETKGEPNQDTHNETQGQQRYNLRPNRTPNYLRRFAFFSVKTGIKKWSDKAREAVMEELRMFIKEKVFKGLRKPTAAQMKKALMIHCFVIEKRDGRIKARAVADGSGQQRYTEEETYSPTVRLESLMLSSLIDAFEGRQVATVDIKGAFLKAKVPEELELIVKMTGELAQMMCELDSSLECDEHGVLYLRCDKALYGHIEAARLFYDDLHESITKKMNFKQNGYDPCVYNKRTNEGSVAIRVHVDDLKISARSQKQLNLVIEQLREIYDEITVHSGLEHDYLGMILTYHPGQQSVTLNMTKYVEGCIEEFVMENEGIVLKKVVTPATSNLFRVRNHNEIKKISVNQAKIFHSTVAKLLFLAKRGRPDVLLAVSFLTTRVKSPDEDDWKKLLRVLSYLKHTNDLTLTITCKKLENLTWYIDGSYATHEDMRGQNGATLMIGDTTVLTRSNKQKVNTRSSTESELIAIDDALPTVQWAKKFMFVQGYDLETIIKEDK